MSATPPIAASGRTWNPTNPSTPNKPGPSAAPARATPVADTFTPSGTALPVDPKAKGTDLAELLRSTAEDTERSGGNAVDLTRFQRAMKEQLVEQMKQAQLALQAAGKDSKFVSDILYAVDKDQKAADVPDEWGADQTSQRIVDFALAFRGAAKGMSDEEFIETIRKSIQEGFRSAKGDLKDLPGPSAKLFNDTYEAAMKKLDDTLATWKNEAANPSTSNTTAAPKPAPTGPASSFSVVA
jgi:hypothetical protein